jgi:hypothetical protein
MKCSITLICIVLASYSFAQNSIQSWAGNVANVNVNCPVVIIGDQCPSWAIPLNASGIINNIFSTNTQILTSLGTDSLRSTSFNFGAPDPLIDNQALTGGRVNILFDQDNLLLGLNLLGGAQIDVIYTNAITPALNRTFALSASSLADVQLLGIDLSLLSAEASSGNLAGLTAGDVKDGNWQVNFRLSGLSISIVTVLSVDAIELEFDYEAPLFLDLIIQNYAIEKDALHLEWLVNERNSVLDYHVQKLIEGSWEEISKLMSIDGYLTYTDTRFKGIKSCYRLCARNIDQSETCFPVIAVNSEPGSELVLYPNPILSDQILQISGTDSVNKVEVFSPDGNVSYPPFECNDGTCKVDIQFLKTGVFILRIYEKEHKRSQHKLLVFK